MKKQLYKSKLAIAIACSTACLSQTAVAQLEEVVVTANKREQVLQDIPSSITAMTGEMLADRGITDARDLDKIVPSMLTGTGNRGEATINIRGVGYNEVGSPGVALHVDGVYQPRAGMGIISQLDVQRVEILRGPQSTLYGRNANGGVVNYITQTPTDEFEGSISVGYAEYDQTSITATINAPISDTWGARLTLTGRERNEGFYENINNNGEDLGTIDSSYAGRLTLAGDINDNVALTFIATVSEAEEDVNGTSVFNDSYNPALAGQELSAGDFEVAHTFAPDSEQSYEALTAIVDWNIGEWSLKSTTGYQKYDYDRTADFDNLLQNTVINQTINKNETFSQEINLSGSIGDVDSSFGAFYMNDESENAVIFTFPEGFIIFPASPLPGIQTLNPSYDTTSIALYADATWHITDSFRLLGGLRYSQDEQSAYQDNTQQFGPTTIVECDQTTDLDDSSTIGRFGGQLDITDNSNMYATYSQGVKTGGVNYRSGCENVFLDEEIESLELGWKGRFDDGRLTTNVSAFYYDYTDLQTEQIVGFSAEISNAPGAEVIGLELDGAWIPDEHWSINASLSLLDATYSESFENLNAGLSPGPMGPVITDVEGNRLNYAPEVSSNISVGYQTNPILAGGTLDFRVDANYRSEVTLREFQNDDDVTDPVTLIGLSAKWLSASEDYSLRLFVDNATNEAYYTWMGASNFLGYSFATWNTPRQYGLEFKAKF